MEKHFLDEHVAGLKRDQARKPWYSEEGDCIFYQVSDEATVGDRIDEILTIYRSLEGKVIGFQVKGVRTLIETFGLSVDVHCNTDTREKEFSLVAVLLFAYERGPKTIGRRLSYVSAVESVVETPRVCFDRPSKSALAVG